MELQACDEICPTIQFTQLLKESLTCCPLNLKDAKSKNSFRLALHDEIPTWRF
jgi:hypothetical protein